MPLAVPIIMAAGSIGGGLLANRAAGQANKAMRPVQQAQSEAARQQLELQRLTMPLVSSTTDYYSKLIHGDRATMTAALQPELTGIADTYRGAERGLDRNAAGPSKDLARAELGRQRVGQMGGLFFNARNRAVEGAAGLVNTGANAGSAGVSIFNNLAYGMRADRDFNAGQSEKFGAALGPLLADIYKAWKRPKYPGTPPILGPAAFGQGNF